MKTKVITLGLLVITAAIVGFYPEFEKARSAATTNVLTNTENSRPVIEAVFVLDTTGSMSGLIEAAKEKIWSIASTMATAEQAPEIRIGLVGYRDRGDVYVTKITDLSSNLDSVYTTLMGFQAGGGGDGPESVNKALYDAVHNISWSQNEETYKVVFLIGDAPPHMDYRWEVKYPETIKFANQAGITVNAIQAGEDKQTLGQWQQIAQLGMGSYFQVEQTGNAVAITTPFDEELAVLSRELDETRLYYGSREKQAEQVAKAEETDRALETASPAARARRAAFNVSESGKFNFRGDAELVDDISSGLIDLSTMDQDELPASLRALEPEEQAILVKETAEQRSEVKQKIQHLSEQRSSYLKDQVAALGGAEDSLDSQLFRAVRGQAKKKGIVYTAEGPEY
jgi:Mg-chelatase subunit ChlD